MALYRIAPPLTCVVLAVASLSRAASPVRPGPLTTAVAECEALITQNGSTWVLHCVPNCSPGCTSVATTSNDGTAGYACSCNGGPPPACCHLVFVPNAVRKAKPGGVCGTDSGCEAGITCEVWKIGNENSEEWTYFEKCTFNT